MTSEFWFDGDVKEEEIPDVAGALIGYRVFKYRIESKYDIRLKSTVVRDHEWCLNSPMKAEHYTNYLWRPTPWQRDDHVAPAEGCECGLYAFNSLGHITKSSIPILLYGGDSQKDSCIVARLNLWGKVIVAEKGYRSEYAEITGIVKGLTKPDYLAARIAHINNFELVGAEDENY